MVHSQGRTSDYELAARRVKFLRAHGQERWLALNTVAAHYRMRWQALRDYLKNRW
jgi:hypothetical protein